MVSEEPNSDIELASEIVPVPQVVSGVEAPEVLDNINEANLPHGKPRHRKNALHAAILKQMEFYFSDSNLSKDRFLGGLVKKDPNIDIDVFLKFNRIRSLTTDKGRIAKALRKSQILKVSEDGCKVCRITPIIEKVNTDDCTVYVQRLPSDADHDWLTTLFSKYGSVAYVSIPKFKFNQKIKGFAFVEFNTPEDANKCLKAFRLKGCELPSQTSPSDVLSITTFLEEEQENNGLKDENAGDLDHDSVNKNCEPKSEKLAELNKPKAKKRKKSLKVDDPDDSVIDPSDHIIKPKRRKDNDSEDLNISASDSNVEGEEKRRKRKFKTTLGVDDSEAESQKIFKDDSKKQKKVKPVPDGDNNGENDTNTEISTVKNNEEFIECSNLVKAPEKHKKKKRKRKHHSTFEVINAVEMGLQIMAKKDWKRLRNKYLELQRSKMKQLKLHMKRARWNQNVDKNKMETEFEEKSTPCLDFTPGVIVKMTINDPCIDVKSFKAALKSNSSIKYIDIKEGAHEAFIRCDSSEAAKLLVQKNTEEKSCVVLTDKEEKSYWDKIKNDREQKIKNKIRVKHRGRDKLLKKAEKELGKHIRFDEVKEE